MRSWSGVRKQTASWARLRYELKIDPLRPRSVQSTIAKERLEFTTSTASGVRILILGLGVVL